MANLSTGKCKFQVDNRRERLGVIHMTDTLSVTLVLRLNKKGVWKLIFLS